jgi:hypothetical protein
MVVVGDLKTPPLFSLITFSFLVRFSVLSLCPFSHLLVLLYPVD